MKASVSIAYLWAISLAIGGSVQEGSKLNDIEKTAEYKSNKYLSRYNANGTSKWSQSSNLSGRHEKRDTRVVINGDQVFIYLENSNNLCDFLKCPDGVSINVVETDSSGDIKPSLSKPIKVIINGMDMNNQNPQTGTYKPLFSKLSVQNGADDSQNVGLKVSENDQQPSPYTINENSAQTSNAANVNEFMDLIIKSKDQSNPIIRELRKIFENYKNGVRSNTQSTTAAPTQTAPNDSQTQNASDKLLDDNSSQEKIIQSPISVQNNMASIGSESASNVYGSDIEKLKIIASLINSSIQAIKSKNNLNLASISQNDADLINSLNGLLEKMKNSGIAVESGEFNRPNIPNSSSNQRIVLPIDLSFSLNQGNFSDQNNTKSTSVPETSRKVQENSTSSPSGSISILANLPQPQPLGEGSSTITISNEIDRNKIPSDINSSQKMPLLKQTPMNATENIDVLSNKGEGSSKITPIASKDSYGIPIAENGPVSKNVNVLPQNPPLNSQKIMDAAPNQKNNTPSVSSTNENELNSPLKALSTTGNGGSILGNEKSSNQIGNDANDRDLGSTIQNLTDVLSKLVGDSRNSESRIPMVENIVVGSDKPKGQSNSNLDGSNGNLNSGKSQSEIDKKTMDLLNSILEKLGNIKGGSNNIAKGSGMGGAGPVIGGSSITVPSAGNSNVPTSLSNGPMLGSVSMQPTTNKPNMGSFNKLPHKNGKNSLSKSNPSNSDSVLSNRIKYNDSNENINTKETISGQFPQNTGGVLSNTGDGNRGISMESNGRNNNNPESTGNPSSNVLGSDGGNQIGQSMPNGGQNSISPGSNGGLNSNVKVSIGAKDGMKGGSHSRYTGGPNSNILGSTGGNSGGISGPNLNPGVISPGSSGSPSGNLLGSVGGNDGIPARNTPKSTGSSNGDELDPTGRNNEVLSRTDGSTDDISPGSSKPPKDNEFGTAEGKNVIKGGSSSGLTRDPSDSIIGPKPVLGGNIVKPSIDGKFGSAVASGSRPYMEY
ncbi:hypothetical protein AYI68_g385 [Smittium mucronatum]|uniref:Uncharacterized protein n=1 Tax=Smittium mucronatum TaxID=133383 RepID=A0A1R0H8J0_9FUNG|nr:hypothetical protein AYI68_g385 [Smittium mucronatum]